MHAMLFALHYFNHRKRCVDGDEHLRQSETVAMFYSFVPESFCVRIPGSEISLLLKSITAKTCGSPCRKRGLEIHFIPVTSIQLPGVE